MYTSVLVTDMAENTEEINPRPLEEIEYSSDEVRVEIDGDLYAYRDGKWHIIVADGDAEKDQWTEKVAAVRTHVIRNERLWTIPSNWEPIVSAGSYYRYFSIEGSDVDVKIKDEDAYGVTSQRYEVRAVGEFKTCWDKEWGAYSAKKASDQAEEDAASEGVADALSKIRHERNDYEQWFAQFVAHEGTRRLDKMCETDETLPGGTFDGWDEPFDISEFLVEYTHIDKEIVPEVADYIREFAVFPEYPSVRPRIDTERTLPDDYQMRALIQSGCSPDEAVDYLMTEIHRIELGEWTSERAIEEDAVLDSSDRAEKILGKYPGTVSFHK
jgi:hypothetical protein